jgi:hypothetical protein
MLITIQGLRRLKDPTDEDCAKQVLLNIGALQDTIIELGDVSFDMSLRYVTIGDLF